MNSAISNKRIIRHLRISIIICFGSLPIISTSDSKCSRPDLMSATGPLYIYQETFANHTTVVYHCLFEEKYVCNGNLCVNCKGTGPNVNTNSTLQYSDITKQCISAFETNKFLYYTGSLSNHTAYVYRYECDNNASLNRTITVTFNQYYATVDTAQGKITLRSGTVCEYSSGWCHDRVENIDVLWKLEINTISCARLRRVYVSQSYHFKLNGKDYVIVESHSKYFTFEWNNVHLLCGINGWEIEKGKLIVTPEPIVAASNRSVVDIAYWHHAFWSKQNLYDFLFAKCLADLNNSRVDALFEKFKLKDEQEYAKKLEVDQERSLSKTLKVHQEPSLFKKFARDRIIVTKGEGNADGTSWKLNGVFCILIIVTGFQVLLVVAFMSTFVLKFLQRYFPKKKGRRCRTPRADFELKPTKVQSTLYESVKD